MHIQNKNINKRSAIVNKQTVITVIHFLLAWFTYLVIDRIYLSSFPSEATVHGSLLFFLTFIFTISLLHKISVGMIVSSVSSTGVLLYMILFSEAEFFLREVLIYVGFGIVIPLVWYGIIAIVRRMLR